MPPLSDVPGRLKRESVKELRVPILVAYNEIALKSRYVRSSLERTLCSQIDFVLHKAGFKDAKAKRRWGRIVVDGAPFEAADSIAKIFGVVHSIPSEVTDAELDAITNLAVRVADERMPEGGTFAVRPKVVGTKSYGSRDIAVKIGAAILDTLKSKGARVNLTEPNLTVYIEVRDSDAFIYTDIVKGVGGLPYGSQGKAIALFSGGIDSPVASWLMMKRGVAITPLFMDQTPFVGESYLKRARDAFFAVKKYAPTPDFSLYSAPMGPIMERIVEHPELRFTCVLCKRAMYRIAEDFSMNRGSKGIVTGESLGQVASQTLDNLFVLDSAVRLPVFRPLIGMDKVETERIARDIGTYKITAKKVEGCKAVPKIPATTSSIDKIEGIEHELNLQELCTEVASKIVKIE